MPLTHTPSRLGNMAVWDRPSSRAEPDRTVLLLHGLPTCKEMWFGVMDRLPATWRVIAPDLPDFGASDRVAKKHGHAQRAGALQDVIRALDLANLDLVGHDLSSSVVAQYLGDFGVERLRTVSMMSPPVYPDFKRPARVVAFSSPGIGEVLAPLGKHGILVRTIREGMHHPDRLGDPFLSALRGSARGRAGTKALLRQLRWGRPKSSFAPYPATFRSLTLPTLIVQGRQDPWIPFEHAERLRDDIPDSRLVVIEDGGHFLPIDTPVEVADALVGFLADH